MPSMTLEVFRRSLMTERPWGAAVTETQLAFGTQHGKSLVIPIRDIPNIKLALAAVREADATVWCPRAPRAAVALHRLTEQPLARLTWLKCATVAQAIVQPGTDSWVSMRRDRPKLNAAGAARQAVATARLMAELQAGAPHPTRAAVMNSARLEQLWRPIQARGWRVDTGMLERELSAHSRLRAQAQHDLGVDVLDETEAGTARTHSWLADAGITITDKDGKPSLSRSDADRAVVPDTNDAHLAWTQFREARHIGSRLTTLKQMDYFRRGSDRVYPDLVLHHARTGRGTVLRPSLHSTTAALRPLLIAEPGYVLVSLDLSQVEPRVAAALSQDVEMRRALLAGDIYTELALRVRGDATARSTFKTGFLSVLYGSGEAGLAEKLGCDTSEARTIITDIWDAYPQLKAYADRLKMDMRAGKPELTIGGRPVPPPPPAKGEYTILNSRIQATAADIFYAGVVRVASLLGAESLWMPFHDELIVMVKDDDAEQAARALREGMSEERAGIPITGEPHILGRAWRKT